MEVKNLKKYKKMAYVFLVIIILGMSVAVYANVNKDSKKDNKETSEIEFIETKLVDLLNEMNHIETRNYSVSVSEITKQSQKKENQESKSSTSDGQDLQSESGSGGESGQEGTNNSEDSSQETESSKKFELKSNGVLSNSSDIDWNYVKSEIETLYSSIPTITLDLYQINIAQEDILGFNKEFDNLTKIVKQENKEGTLKELSALYEYIPKFVNSITDDEMKKCLIESKSNLFKAYSKLDSKNWNEISKDTKQAISTYSKLLTNTNIDSSKQYGISKGYIMINELQNAVDLQDESVFLIKYKNILEEINNL